MAKSKATSTKKSAAKRSAAKANDTTVSDRAVDITPDRRPLTKIQANRLAKTHKSKSVRPCRRHNRRHQRKVQVAN